MNKAYMIGEKNGQKYVAHTATRPPWTTRRRSPRRSTVGTAPLASRAGVSA